MRRYGLTIAGLIVVGLLIVGFPFPAASLLLLVAGYYLLRWLLYELAKSDFLMTLRTEGEIKAIMNGNICVAFIMSVANYIIDPDDADIFKTSLEKLEVYAQHLARQAVTLRTTKPSFVERKLVEVGGVSQPQLCSDFERRLRKANSPTLFEKLFGVVWVGLPPRRVFEYRFLWVKYAQKRSDSSGPAKAEMVMEPRDEVVTSLFANYALYGAVVDDAETGAGDLAGATSTGTKIPERIEVVLGLVIETTTRNPRKTLFRVGGLSAAGDWLNALTKLARDAVRQWVSEVTYNDLLGNQTKITEALERIRQELNSGTIVVTAGSGIQTTMAKK